ncbi:TPA: hypothetical protein DCQ44_03505 [Candidatus Taylorbacteria bacterium]|nr:hypothetical protein [Candidatus Taylorbacteria bacterium]
MFPEDKNKIEELKKTLYSRENYKPDNPVHNLSPKQYDVNGTWTPPNEPIMNRRRWPLGKILIWFSIIFFLVAVGIAGFVYYNGYNTVSADNVDISITGPTTIDAGRDGTFALAIDNKNQLDLQDAYLNIEYPTGTRRDASQTEPLVQDRIPLGTITSGSHIDRTISAAFFGLQDTQEKIRISLEYHVLGSLNLFAKNKDYLFVLGAGPISVNVSHVDQVNSGQDVSFNVVVSSNSQAVLSSLALTAEYPFGFTFKNASPAASVNNSVWQIGNLAPGESRTINITGKLEGQENEQRAFKFNVGTINPADSRQLATVFYVRTENVNIQKPFISLNLALNGDSNVSYATYAGNQVTASVAYENNMPTTLTDAVIIIKLDGPILDKSSINSSHGFYQSSDNTITWDKRAIPELGSLSPGAGGTLDFSLNTLAYSNGASYAKSSQKVSLVASAAATQVTSSGSRSFSSDISRSILINSNINLMANAVYNSGPFTNTGSIPPKAEKTTTYTINWIISNTFNNTSNVMVSAVLPSYMKFLDKISPINESVAYDPISGKVTWNVGNIKTNTGFVSAPRQVSFQVSISPSLTQVGLVPTLMGDSTLQATDAFTNAALSSVSDSLTTDITTDPQYKYGIGSVVK